eukprot:CAMPEP_0196657158 /NCGR_PEP_ID=MMETSP1086-20130531/22172_1 /TAXON_ID=77921 /ORGANISM="Cyanoptyche  gloeocystis , Strain SAG4.97" /LENGTH=168 /DNA_ID=CAMNT_0041990185 /DNA_START=49 /DNA_END=555 /DNA_ORIENTATION=+
MGAATSRSSKVVEKFVTQPRTQRPILSNVIKDGVSDHSVKSTVNGDDTAQKDSAFHNNLKDVWLPLDKPIDAAAPKILMKTSKPLPQSRSSRGPVSEEALEGLLTTKQVLELFRARRDGEQEALKVAARYGISVGTYECMVRYCSDYEVVVDSTSGMQRAVRPNRQPL